MWNLMIFEDVAKTSVVKVMSFDTVGE
eukprot:COSAG06_NODE_80930_length_104_cov_28.000000_1_plen_26_part_01